MEAALKIWLARAALDVERIAGPSAGQKQHTV